MLNRQAAAPVLIVGGGLAGLLLALRLCRKGMQVAVLEQQASFGGFNGRLDAATPLVCYSGLGLEPEGSLARLLAGSRLFGATPPRRMAVSDYVWFGDEQYALPGSLDAWQAWLGERFPSERSALATVCADMRRVHGAIADSSGVRGMAARGAAFAVLRRFASLRYRDYLNATCTDPQLLRLLAVRAFSSDNSALTMLAYLAKILIDGAYALPGAGAALTDELVAQLRAQPGCRLLASAPVAQILFGDDARAVGVRLADGTEMAGSVVLNIDPAQLQNSLVSEGAVLANLEVALAPHPVALSALNLIFTVGADLGRALGRHRDVARFFCSDDADPFAVLAAREAGNLDGRNAKINIEFDALGVAQRVYAELDCAAQAADFGAMAGREAQALAPLVDSVKARLRRLQPDFDDGITRLDVLTPHRFGALTGNRGGAASGFSDRPGTMRALDQVLARHGMLQIGQWSIYGSGLSQLDMGAQQACATLVRQKPAELLTTS